MAMKNGVNWGNGFAIGDANTKNCPLQRLRLQINEENFTLLLPLRRTFLSKGSSCIQKFFEVTFYYTSLNSCLIRLDQL